MHIAYVFGAGAYLGGPCACPPPLKLGKKFRKEQN